MNINEPPIPQPRPDFSAKASEEPRSKNEATKFVEQALQFEGQPYVWGAGHDQSNRVQPVDCSGLVIQAAQMTPVRGVIFGGKASEMQDRGEAVPLDAASLKPGDLLFHGEPADHVGIYLGNGQVLHASQTAGQVVVEKLTDAVARDAFDSARRLFKEPAQEVAVRDTWRLGGGDALALNQAPGSRSSLRLPGV